MSLQAALQFIQKVRQEKSLQSRIQALENDPSLESLVVIGAEAGFVFTIAELQAAHKHDWAMRWFKATHL